MIIKLSNEQKIFLIENVISQDQFTIIDKFKRVFNKWEININEDIIDNIRDLCIDKLQIVGFDENYKLNKDGIILEELIDLFYVE